MEVTLDHDEMYKIFNGLNGFVCARVEGRHDAIKEYDNINDELEMKICGEDAIMG